MNEEQTTQQAEWPSELELLTRRMERLEAQWKAFAESSAGGFYRPAERPIPAQEVPYERHRFVEWPAREGSSEVKPYCGKCGRARGDTSMHLPPCEDEAPRISDDMIIKAQAAQLDRQRAQLDYIRKALINLYEALRER